MNARTATWLVLYGDLLMALSLGGVLLARPVAETSLYLGAACGALAILCGILGARGCRWSLLLALPTVAVATLGFAGQSGLSWLAVWKGNPGKLLAASLLALMLAVSLPMLACLLKALKTGHHQKSGTAA